MRRYRPAPPATARAVRLLAALRRLPPAERHKFYDALAGAAFVEGDGWRVRERSIRRERFPDRNREIRLRHAKGESYGQLALAFGISSSGIAKIVQRGRRQKSLDAMPMSRAHFG